MKQTYTMRLKTTGNQRKMLDALLAQLCELYNMALQQRRDVWKSHRKSIGFYEHCRQLTELRNGLGEYQQFPVAIQRDPLRRIDLAFKAFFRRVKGGETPGYPRFKPLSQYDSFTVNKYSFTYTKDTVHIAKLGVFRLKTGFGIKGVPLELRIRRLGNKWIAQLVCDIGKAPSKNPIHTAVGIDLGLTTLVTLSNGGEIKNPRWIEQEKIKLEVASRNLSRKRKGSKNRDKAKERLRRVHQRIAGKRKSYITAEVKRLVNDYDLIAHENLSIKKLAQSRRAKNIMDAAWGQLIERLRYEAEKAGTTVISVNPFNTTKVCSGCGGLVPKTLKQRLHYCLKCGLYLGRDHNAALNILALGMRAASQQNIYSSQSI